MLKSAIFITLLSLHNKKNEQIQLIYIAFLRYRSLNILTLNATYHPSIVFAIFQY